MDILTYALAKSYTDKALLGVGTIKGAPCTVKSQTEDDEYVYVTLGWENNLGTPEETVVKIKKGADGAPGETGPAGDPGPQGVSITKIEKIKTEDLIDTYQISFSDNTTFEYTISNGSTDYLKITNKPSIEGVELIGNKTFEDLNIASADALSATDENLQNLSDLIGDKTSLPAPTDTIVNNITSVNAKVDAIIDDNEVGLAKTFSSDKITKTFATKEEIPTVPNKVSELTNDSNYQTAEQVNSTVTTEIAKIVADAPEDLNTLKEMSDWIAGHENDASAMNSAISDNKTAITALQTGKADKSEIPTTLPANGGNSDTVNNHTVETDVPVDAVFTDTIYDDTEVKESIEELNSNLDGLGYGENGAYNILDLSKLLTLGFSIEEGNITNIKTDTRTNFYLFISLIKKDGTYKNTVTENILQNGSKDFTFSIPSGCEKMIMKHNGSSNDIFIANFNISEFGLKENDTITAHISVSSNDPTVVGGIVINELAIVKGSTFTEYKPYIPSVKMLAEEVNQQNENLDVLQYGDTHGGYNIFKDTTWFVGRHMAENGINDYPETGSAYSDYISIVEPNTYYISSSTHPKSTVFEYDANKSFIKYNGWKKDNNTPCVLSGNCAYIRISFNGASSNIQPSNVMLAKTSNLPYEPYIPSVKMLAKENSQQSTEAMDIKMLGWTVPSECPVQNYVDSDGIFHQRVGRVDLGSLSWEYISDLWNGVFLWDGTFDSQIRHNSINGYGVCYKYNTVYSAEYNNDKWIYLKNNGNKFYIRDTSYSGDAAAFKQAMQGVYLYYELETPITNTIDGNEVTERINESLDEQGLINKFEPNNLQRGYWNDSCSFVSGTGNVSPKTPYICKDGDLITVKLTSSQPIIYLKFFNSSDTLLKKVSLNNVSCINEYAPSGAVKFVFTYDTTSGTETIENMKYKGVYYNNTIDELKNDLDKLNLLPKGFIIQIDADKDNIETTKQKYGWQYLGTSNIEYESGSANILVTNVYRKNN